MRNSSGIVAGSRRANPHSIAIAKDSVCFRAVRRRVIVPSIPSVLWTSPRQISVFGPSSSRPSRKVWVPDLIDNTFGSTPPALRRGYASRVNVPVAFECQVRSGLPTVLVHFRLWRFRTRLWRIITRRRWESRTYKARSAGRPSAENSCSRSRL